jgi:hypothetical protein
VDVYVFDFIVGVTVDENVGNGATAARAGNVVGELDGLIIRATVELLVSVGVGRIVGVGVGTSGRRHRRGRQRDRRRGLASLPLSLSTIWASESNPGAMTMTKPCCYV